MITKKMKRIIDAQPLSTEQIATLTTPHTVDTKLNYYAGKFRIYLFYSVFLNSLWLLGTGLFLMLVGLPTRIKMLLKREKSPGILVHPAVPSGDSVDMRQFPMLKDEKVKARNKELVGSKMDYWQHRDALKRNGADNYVPKYDSVDSLLDLDKEGLDNE